jgi:hypothetical protein
VTLGRCHARSLKTYLPTAVDLIATLIVSTAASHAKAKLDSQQI